MPEFLDTPPETLVVVGQGLSSASQRPAAEGPCAWATTEAVERPAALAARIASNASKGRHARVHHPGRFAAGRPQVEAPGATVVGISPDKPAARDRFDTRYGLGFPLLSDPDHAVAEAYGAWGERSMYGKQYMGIIRSAFVIDEDGRIAETLYEVSPKGTVPKAMAALSR